MSGAGSPSDARSRLHLLAEQYGQSPWLDNLSRPMLMAGRLTELVGLGVRGVTSNPTIFAKAMAGGGPYDDRFRQLVGTHTVEDAYWEMVIEDVGAALDVLAPVHDATGGDDGFVSLEVAPALAHDTEGTVRSARDLRARTDHANLLVKVPATAEGVAAVRTLVGEGAGVNVTLIFGLDRYEEVVEAYLSGLEAHPGDLSGVHGVASFFVSRVDTLVDRRLEAIGTADALALRGRVALAQARTAYQLFRRRFSGPRWEALAARGAHVQRPLWASTSAKNPAYPDLLYVEGLVGPDTVDTMPDDTLAAFADHGALARSVDADPAGASAVLEAAAAAGVDLDDVARVLEDEGVASFAKSYDEAVQVLADKANALAAGDGP